MPRFTRSQKKKILDQPSQETESTPLIPTSCLPTNPTFFVSEDNLDRTLPEKDMQKLTCLKKQKKSYQPSQGTESRPFPQPTNTGTSFHPPSDQDTLQQLRSIHSISRPTSMDQAASKLAPTVNLNSYPSRPVHSLSRTTSIDQVSPQASRSIHSISLSASVDQDSTESAPTVQVRLKKHSGRQSATHWVVDAIDSRGNVKILKLKVQDVLNLSDEQRIIVNFDIYGEPYGDARSLLSGFCGDLACDCLLFPINFEKWPSIPISYFDNAFDKIIKPKFFFKVDEAIARRHVSQSMCKKWGSNRGNLWRITEDKRKTKAQIMEKVPEGIPRDQWISFVEYQYKDSTLEMRKRNTENRKKQIIPHTGGSKANATRRAEIMAETGKMPGRGQMYLATHKNKDGVYVNEAAKEICEKIESTLKESTIDESQISPNDAVGKVLGPEHSGRVRCMGLGVVPSRVFKQVRPRFGGTGASTSEGSCSFKCQENQNQIMTAQSQMMNAFKAYIIMKEGTIPEQFVGFFASPSPPFPTTPSDAASGSVAPMDGRR